MLTSQRQKIGNFVVARTLSPIWPESSSISVEACRSVSAVNPSETNGGATLGVRGGDGCGVDVLAIV